MEGQAKTKTVGGLEGPRIPLSAAVGPPKGMGDAAARMWPKEEILLEPGQHPTVPGLLVLKTVRPAAENRARGAESQAPPSAPPAAPAGPDHQARLALLERIDRLLGLENRVSELEAENAALERVVARLAAENYDLRRSAGASVPAAPPKGQ